LDSREKIRVDPLIAKSLIQQIEDDAHLFQRLNINDYSLLMGIHRFKNKEEALHIKRMSPNIKQFIKNSFKLKDPPVLLPNPNINLKTMPSFGLNDGGASQPHRQSVV
jgi:hypothetical protein